MSETSRLDPPQHTHHYVVGGGDTPKAALKQLVALLDGPPPTTTDEILALYATTIHCAGVLREAVVRFRSVYPVLRKIEHGGPAGDIHEQLLAEDK